MSIIYIQHAACPAGTYRYMTDNHDLKMCRPCPMNTVTDDTGAEMCMCVDGYFRNQTNEGPEVDCTCMSD